MAGLTKLERALLGAVALLTALAGAANYSGWAAVPRFALATLALAGLAWAVALGTEQLGEHIGTAATGVLQATLGNLPELLVVVFALKAGDLVVAQTALVGSLLASALLVLGLTIVAGAQQAPDGIMRFSSRLPNDATTLLLVTVFLIVLIGLALSSGSAAGAHVDTISVVGACCLLGVYATWLVPYLRPTSTATGARAPQPPQEQARISLRTALLLLVAAGVGAGFVSEWFVSALRPGDRDAAHLHRVRRPRDRGDRRQRGRALRGHHASGARQGRPRDRSRQELGRADRRVPLPGAGADLPGAPHPADVRASTDLHRRFGPDDDRGVAGHRDGEAAAFEGWALAAIYVIVAVVAAYQ